MHPQPPLRCFSFLLLFGAISLCGGCGPREKIARYTAPKPELIDPTLTSSSSPNAGPGTLSQATPAEATGAPQQTLGAIVLLEKAGWFFKLTGDPQLVQPQQEAFRKFIETVRFSAGEDPKPSWTLPATWKETAGSQMRFATILIEAEGKPLELTVIPLDKNTSDQEFVLANVNRWRDQVGLPPIGASDLSKNVESMKVGDHDAVLVSVVGTAKGGGGMGSAPFAPFAGSVPVPSTTPSTTSEPRPATNASSVIAYEAPSEWTPGRMNEFRKAAFNVADGDATAEITVIDLELGAGDLLQNVNRWRDQVGLPAATAAEVAESTKKISTLGASGDYVELFGPKGGILGVRVLAGGKSWFVKLTGDVDLAKREKPRFEEFVKSLKLK